jgi:hypothetical protein
MSQKTFSLVAGVFFLLAVLGHVLRITSGASVVIQNTSIPMWASLGNSASAVEVRMQRVHEFRASPYPTAGSNAGWI